MLKEDAFAVTGRFARFAGSGVLARAVTSRLERTIALPSRSPTAAPLGGPRNEALDGLPGRRRFIEAVARELDAVGAEYVFLHGYELDHRVDSDVDIAVDRKSLDVVDATIRRGVFGRLVQCLHYADPWCRYYVVRVDEPGRRYRELDVACDPWGVGPYGPAVQVALSNAVVEEGMRVPSAAARTLHLAIKKARKRQFDNSAHELLTRAFARDPKESSELLEKHLGRAGRDLGQALETGQESIRSELGAVRKTLLKRWISPAMLTRWAAFETSRSLRRVLHPTGLVIGITAPDGAGKSTLASKLEAAAHGPFRRFRRYHLRPGLLPPPARLLGRTPASGEKPHGREPSGVAGSLARLAYLWIDTFVGWVPKVRIPEIRSTLVVLERGWLDLVVDPRRYRLSSPVALTRLLARTLPLPAVILRLETPADVLARRASELDVRELDRQLEAWRELAAADPERFVGIDASRPAEEVVSQALDVIDDRLASRQDDLRHCELALATLGGLRVGETPYRIVFAPRGVLARGPRWLLPVKHGARGALTSGLFRPARLRHSVQARALEVVQRLSLPLGGTRVTVATNRGLEMQIGDALGLQDVELAVAVTGDSLRGERVLASVWHDSRIVAFAKIAREEGTKLEHERHVLDLLGSCELRTLIVPEVLGFFEWRDCKVLLLAPLQVECRVNRSPGIVELAALAELAGLSTPLAPVLGMDSDRIPVHGDFAPWNSCPSIGGRLVLWDWEEAHLGLPLEDLLNWRLQLAIRFAHGTIPDLVRTVLGREREFEAACASLSTSSTLAPAALKRCIDRTLQQGRHVSDAGPRWARIMRELEAADKLLTGTDAAR